MNVTFESTPEYLFVHVKGQLIPDELGQILQEIANTAEEMGYSHILIDAFEMLPPRTDFHRFRAGEDVASVFGPTLRVAAVYPEEMITRFAENTAVNRGAKFIVLSRIDEAREWLMER